MRACMHAKMLLRFHSPQGRRMHICATMRAWMHAILLDCKQRPQEYKDRDIRKRYSFDVATQKVSTSGFERVSVFTRSGEAQSLHWMLGRLEVCTRSWDAKSIHLSLNCPGKVSFCFRHNRHPASSSLLSPMHLNHHFVYVSLIPWKGITAIVNM